MSEECFEELFTCGQGYRPVMALDGTVDGPGQPDEIISSNGRFTIHEVHRRQSRPQAVSPTTMASPWINRVTWSYISAAGHVSPQYKASAIATADS